MSEHKSTMEERNKLKKPRILVVDDDAGMLRAMSALLMDQGEITTAGGVKEATDQLKAHPFDLVVTDYEMGDGTGIDVLDCALFHHPETPVIVVTAYGTKERAIQMINHQVFALLEKPVDPEEIEIQVKRALTKKEAFDILNRLASLGESAGDIVHEIANPLMLLKDHVWRIQKNDLWPNHIEMLRAAERMSVATDRITHVINWARNSLRATSEPQMLPFTMRGILDQLKDACAAKAARHMVPVIITPGSDLKIVGDRSQLLQVLVNLVNNGIDAAVAHDDKWVMVEIRAEGAGRFAQVTVTDSGNGIPEEARNKLFTPLFTTKGGKGTGLGLSIVQKIVHAHGGEIFLNPENPNTQFVITLPTAA